MSGGVDSSVAAWLLRQEGWDVVGASLILWTANGPKGRDACTSPGAEAAARVCEKLGLPHRTIDCREEFRSRVVEPFCEAYFSGRTPNPCVACNPTIKFAQLLRAADELDAQAVATGHYVRIEHDARHLLRRGVHTKKEQSYVLYRLRQDQLARCVFPLGARDKPEVRRLAEQAGLETHDRPESQEICFIPGHDYGEFLSRVAPERVRPGRIVNTSGEFLARHRGIHRFTLGQRRKLGVAVGEPRYVVRIEPDTATVVIGAKEETLRSTFVARDVNWIAYDDPTEPMTADVKIRYTHRPARARIEPMPRARAATVTFDEPASAITPGQAAVFYDGDLLLGGGTIDAAL